MKTIHTIAAVLTLTSTVTLATNTALTIQILEVNMPTCNGAANGSVLVEAQGGKAPYEYNWNTFPAQTAAQAINLKQGIYFVQVKDADGIVFFQSVEVFDPLQTQTLTASGPESSQTVLVSATNPETAFSCFLNGVLQTENTLTGLPVGIHKLVITDNAACTVMQFIQVFELESETDTIAVATALESTPLHSIEILENESFNITLTMVETE